MSNRPLTDAEIRSLGYVVTPRGWVLVDPDARPEAHPLLCRACEKFTGTMSGHLCAGCVYFGEGDPHGLRRDGIRQRLRERIGGAA